MFQMTLEQLNVDHKKKLDALIDEAGSISHLSRMLNINLDTVYGWTVRGRISKNGALRVVQHKVLGKKFKVIDLRPELCIKNNQ